MALFHLFSVVFITIFFFFKDKNYIFWALVLVCVDQSHADDLNNFGEITTSLEKDTLFYAVD